MINVDRLTIEDAAMMADIAGQVHLDPMSETNIASCFGRFYRAFGIFETNESTAKCCGFIIIHQIFEEASIIDICIAKGFQGKGYGKHLLDYSIADVRRCDGEQFLLEVRASNSTAISLYRSRGFIETGIRKDYYKVFDSHSPNDNVITKEDAVLMQLILT